ncbi:aquaporin-like protein [Microdochium trichocladiopsis]|uniref:Aquaporin-like protein n=1 Tax=Microdochium trichocladiopsis TaxID=1682393 RepID=A0A9P8XS43_9PEZI|nr:aquaporin-like protein [Microdochium trichocladiopsis]KAH7014200.1 aquaporin-like protein [Microdochium trichocladiopsis]
MAQARKRKREAARLQSKLPGVLHSDNASVGKLRKRLVIKNEVIAAVAEFCGTFLFLFFAFGVATQAGQQQLSQSANGSTQTAGTLDSSQLLYSSLGFGFSLAVNAWVFFRVSGGLFNPAVTLGLFLCGAVTWYRGAILFVVQFVAAIAAAGVAQLVIPGGINARTRLGDNASLAQGFFIEMFCTSLLMFAIYMLAGEKHKATFIAPVGIGLALFLAEMFATGITGGSLNPARTLGPDVIAASFDQSTWIYYTAPFVGTMLSAAVYWALKASHYETANVGQDDGDTEALILRDVRGNVTGAVQRVDASEVPHIPGLDNRSTVSFANHPDGMITPHIEAGGGGGGGGGSRAPSIITTGPEGDRASLYSPATAAAGRESFDEKEGALLQVDPGRQNGAIGQDNHAAGVAETDFSQGKASA